MRHISKYFILLEEWTTRILLVTVVCLVFYTSIVRWIGFPVSWSVELAQLIFIWVIFLGANQALRKNRHIGVDIITKRLPQKIQLTLAIIVDLIIVAFLMICVYYGFKASIDNSLRSIQNLPISYSFVTLAVPIGSTLMIITLINKWISLNRKGFETETGGKPKVSSE